MEEESKNFWNKLILWCLIIGIPIILIGGLFDSTLLLIIGGGAASFTVLNAIGIPTLKFIFELGNFFDDNEKAAYGWSIFISLSIIYNAIF